jgi:hypothetical protein
MTRSRKLILTALILLLLPAASSAAGREATPGNRHGIVAGLWHALLRPTVGLRWVAPETSASHLSTPKSGPGMDPNGTPKPAGTGATVPGSSAESGPGMDPNG